MDSLLQQKLQAAQNECNTHLQRLNYAYSNISKFLPASTDTLANLNDEQIEALDQYIYRYTKLQDAMGLRLFKHVLDALAEDIRSMAFIDRLQRLEQLGAIPSSQQWLELRQLRNLLAHEYENHDKERAKIINLVFSKHQTIVNIHRQVQGFIQKTCKPCA